MAYTSSDLSNVETAIIELATGQRTVAVTISDKQITFHKSSLTELKALRDDIKASLGSLVFRTYAKQGGRAS